MIEVAPTSELIFQYDTAWLYCLTLEYNGHKDWRLPTGAEYDTAGLTAVCWYEDDPANEDDDKWFVTPVRDCND